MISEFLLSKVERKGLIYDKAFINGKWVGSSLHQTIAVMNPATDQQIATIPDLSSNEIQHAINTARSAFAKWREVLPRERAQILRKWYDLIVENTEDLAKILTAEQGKPLTEAVAEIKYAASFVEWFSEEASRIHGDVYPEHKPSIRSLGIKEPVGVVAAITPWNFPSSMVTRKVAPALAAGCAVLLKPSEHTPLSALALAHLAELAGVPAGVFSVLTGDAKMIGKMLCDSKYIRKLSFTGSTKVGQYLYGACVGTLKRVSLELGGNAPFIVFEDANLEQAAEGLVALKARGTGQACTSANRVFIHAAVYDEFIKLIIQKYSKLIMQEGFAHNSQQGPLINGEAVSRVKRLVAEAKEAGSKILYQGSAPEIGCFYPNTIIEIPNTSLRIFTEEIFGPIIAIHKFNNDEELIEKANDTDYGLASYFYTQDKSRVWNIAKKLEFGMVGINSAQLSSTMTPFGGIKYSGFGREGSRYGIEEFLHVKYYAMGDI